MSDARLRSPGRVVNYVLGVIPWCDCIVSRRTIGSFLDDRAQKPNGNSSNDVMHARKHLRRLEQRGDIRRGRALVHVLRPDVLAFSAFEGVGEFGLGHIIDVPSALELMKRTLAFEQNPALKRIRESEAELLEALWSRWERGL
jgi:hypothetical protein